MAKSKGKIWCEINSERLEEQFHLAGGFLSISRQNHFRQATPEDSI